MPNGRTSVTIRVNGVRRINSSAENGLGLYRNVEDIGRSLPTRVRRVYERRR